MSTKPQIELFLENENGSQQVAYPFVESDHVSLSNGMDIDTMIRQDVSMPTVTHEDLSFKVGVGDQDVSSAIVDSSVAEMTIKGKTYQNILPEPSTHVLSNNKEMFKVNEGLDPNVEIVDGVSKSAILSGNTLVNLTKTIHGNGNINAQYRDVASIKRELLKPSTKYIAYVFNDGEEDVELYWNSTANFKWKTFVCKSKAMSWSVSSSKDVLIDNDLIFSVQTSQTLPQSLRCVTLEYVEGMENWDIPYFEGMQSVKMPVLKATGKNLFDMNRPYDVITDSQATVVQDTNKITVSSVESGTHVSANFILDKDFFAGKTVTGSCLYESDIKDIGTVQIHYQDGNGDHHYQWIRTPKTFTFPNNFIGDVTLSVCVNNTGTPQSNTVTVKNIQLELGSTATSYEPHKSNILSCQLAPLNQTMFEQGTFAESTPPNTQSYESIKLGSEHLYTTRIRTKGTYKVVKGATYEVRLNDGYGIYVCYCKNGLYSATVNRWLDGTSTFTVPNDCDEMFFAIRKTDNTVISPSDFPLIGLKIYQEVVLRSLPNGVKDTLNLNTGEYVQRIGERTFDGSEDELFSFHSSQNINKPLYRYICIISDMKITSEHTCNSQLYCDKWATVQDSVDLNIGSWSTAPNVHRRIASDRGALYFVVEGKSDTAQLREYLSQNPITVQYELATPVVKTVDLSSSGNWEKAVLNGSENWARHGNYGSVTRFNVTISNMAIGFSHVFSDKFSRGAIATNDLECVNNHYSANQFQLQIKTSRLTSDSVDGLKQYLSQNPITVWYQTATHQDSTQVKQPIFFKDGHIMQSSGTDNSLIPTLDYQAKTSNSYVMDLMKPNTKYTMKAKAANGTFTIDGISYNVGTNTTFTSPSSMTNKFLVMSDKTNEEVMILEGDLTSKDILYFKGIKSAFEGEEGIEIVSIGKNLFDVNLHSSITVREDGVYEINTSDWDKSNVLYTLKPNTTYTLSFYTDHSHCWTCIKINGNTTSLKINESYSKSFATDNTGIVNLGVYANTKENVGITFTSIQLEEDGLNTVHEPHKSNTTKIPLLSPLRSLPDGTCDELIIDRESNKVKIIQRVGELDFSNLQYNTWNVSDSTLSKTVRFTWLSSNMSFYKVKDSSDGICDSIPYIRYNSSDTEHCRFDGSNPSAFMIWVDKSKLTSFDDEGLKKYLSTLPSTRVQYELATPVITEVDLEGFPYIYKDGHIFINGEITPVTEIKYSINQQHQIEANNQDIMRHQKEIDYLYKLIGEYVRVDYKNTLLSLNLELK